VGRDKNFRKKKPAIMQREMYARERVSENVFWFQSEVYAQVTAGVCGPQWAV